MQNLHPRGVYGSLWTTSNVEEVRDEKLGVEVTKCQVSAETDCCRKLDSCVIFHEPHKP